MHPSEGDPDQAIANTTKMDLPVVETVARPSSGQKRLVGRIVSAARNAGRHIAVVVSLAALGLTFLGTYLNYFHKSSRLTLTILSSTVEEDTIEVKGAVVNAGNTEAVLVSASLSRRAHRSSTSGAKTTTVPELPVSLKPGEVLLLKMTAPIGIMHEDIVFPGGKAFPAEFRSVLWILETEALNVDGERRYFGALVQQWKFNQARDWGVFWTPYFKVDLLAERQRKFPGPDENLQPILENPDRPGWQRIEYRRSNVVVTGMPDATVAKEEAPAAGTHKRRHSQ